MLLPLPVVRLTLVFAARVMSALNVIAPLFVSPMLIVPAVTRSSSASVRPSVAGEPLASAPPRSIFVPSVFCFSVTVFEPALIVAFVALMFMLSATRVLLAPVSISIAEPVGPRLIPKPTAGSPPPPVPVSVRLAAPVVVIAAPASTRIPSLPVPVPSVAVPMIAMSPATDVTAEFASRITTPTFASPPAPPVPVSEIVPVPAAAPAEVILAPFSITIPAWPLVAPSLPPCPERMMFPVPVVVSNVPLPERSMPT